MSSPTDLRLLTFNPRPAAGPTTPRSRKPAPRRDDKQAAFEHANTVAALVVLRPRRSFLRLDSSAAVNILSNIIRRFEAETYAYMTGRR